MKPMRYKTAVLLSLLSLPAMLLVATGGPAAAQPAAGAPGGAVTTSSLGSFKPTFVGPAATGCPIDCSLLSGPVSHAVRRVCRVGYQWAPPASREADTARAMPPLDLRQLPYLRGAAASGRRQGPS